MLNKSYVQICVVLFVALAMNWAAAQQSPQSQQPPQNQQPPQSQQPPQDQQAQQDHQAQQDKSKRPSPPGTVQCTINGKKVLIEYSRPSMKGRKIMGGLVPYGKVWRTGANEATTLTTETDLDIGGAKVPAGKYTLYTLPSEGTWKLIINKQTGQWGTEYDEKQDLARVDMKTSEIVVPVQQFTIALDQDTNSSADLILEWEKTRETVVIKAP